MCTSLVGTCVTQVVVCYQAIEQPNEAFAPVLKKNIAYEQIKKPWGQRIDDSQASATTEGEYENVLSQGKAGRAD